MLVLIRLFLGLLLLAMLWLGLKGLVQRDRSYIAASIAAMVLLGVGVAGFIWHETSVRRETPASHSPALAADAEHTYKRLRITAFTDLGECVAQLGMLTEFYARHPQRFGGRLQQASALADQWRARLGQMEPGEKQQFCSDEPELYGFLNDGLAELAALIGRD